MNLDARKVTLPDVAAPATAAAGPITCTYTNTYTPKATLTLVKAVDGGTALPARWTLSANGPTPISGPSGSAAVTAQPVNAGTYTLDEAGAPLGYTSQGWSCTGGTLSGSQLTLVDNDNATCTITNRFSRNSFRIVKQVQGPAGGFTGNGDTPFTGTWTCGGTTGSFSVTQNTPYTSPDIPAGTICTVTETQPTGNLADTSWSWNPPTYPDGNSVTIAEGSVPTVTVRNTFAQATGSLTLSKVVAATSRRAARRLHRRCPHLPDRLHLPDRGRHRGERDRPGRRRSLEHGDRSPRDRGVRPLGDARPLSPVTSPTRRWPGTATASPARR